VATFSIQWLSVKRADERVPDGIQSGLHRVIVRIVRAVGVSTRDSRAARDSPKRRHFPLAILT
jgi:hypothetical protein